MSPDSDLVWITLGALLTFSTLALFSRPVLHFLGRTRGLKPPPPSIVIIFQLWFLLLAAGALWLLLSGNHGLLSRTGTR